MPIFYVFCFCTHVHMNRHQPIALGRNELMMRKLTKNERVKTKLKKMNKKYERMNEYYTKIYMCPFLRNAMDFLFGPVLSLFCSSYFSFLFIEIYVAYFSKYFHFVERWFNNMIIIRMIIMNADGSVASSHCANSDNHKWDSK